MPYPGQWRTVEPQPELMPCPFCVRSVVQLIHYLDIDDYCVKCGACGLSSGRSQDMELIVRTWNTRPREESLEAFAHEALHRLHSLAYHPHTQGILSDEQWAEMKAEDQDFVARHCPNGDFSVAEIHLTPNFNT